MTFLTRARLFTAERGGGDDARNSVIATDYLIVA